MRAQYVLWDFNGTLLNDVEENLAVMNDMLTRRGLSPIPDIERYRGMFTFPVSDYYQAAGFDFSVYPFEALADEYVRLYRAACPGMRLYPDALQAVAKVRRAGAGQAILSACEASILRHECGRLGLTPYMDTLCGADDHLARGKADLGAALLSALTVPSEQVLLCGDTTHDADVARRLGCRCRLIARGHQDTETLKRTGAPVSDTLMDALRSEGF